MPGRLQAWWLRQTVRGLVLLAAVFAAFAHAGEPGVELDTTTQRLSLGGQWSYLIDASRRLTLDDVRQADRAGSFRGSNGATASLGSGEVAYWLHVRLTNQGGLSNQWILEFPYTLLGAIDVYLVYPDGRVSDQRGGGRRPFHYRALPHRTPNFLLPIAADQSLDLYVRLETAGIVFAEATIWRPAAFHEYAENEQMGTGLLLGLLAAFCLYALANAVVARDRGYLLCALWVMSLGLSGMALYGVSAQYLWPERPELNDVAVPLFAGVAGLVFVALARSALDINRRKIVLDLIGRGLLLAFALQVVLVSMSTVVASSLALLLLPAAIVYMMIAAALRVREGMASANWFQLASFALLLGNFLLLAMLLGFWPSHVLAAAGPVLGSAVGALLIAVGLADHSRRTLHERLVNLRREKESIEDEIRKRAHDLRETIESLESANRGLRKSNMIDPLTGIRNRRYFEERLQAEWERSLRGENWLAVILLDLDHFKRINDTFGHPAGDACLVSAAHAISDVIRRSGDRVTRFGGEEFAIVLPATDPFGAARIGETLRKAIADLEVSANGSWLRLTTSVGVAALRPKLGLRPEMLVELADQALYRAKQQGRNRMCVAAENFTPEAEVIEFPVLRAVKDLAN
ncbi:two-component system, sensor histidine kinase LadS [Burkholderiales bacterium]|nr:MAG: diguanylate cyclase [Burkholderiales bacterium]CAG1009123.1 two-component system, sensor histidine kinase LadS [Burkholderiales bacterium]